MILQCLMILYDKDQGLKADGVTELIKIVYPLKSSSEFNTTQVKWKMAYTSTPQLYALDKKSVIVVFC